MDYPDFSKSSKTKPSYLQKNYPELYKKLLTYPDELQWRERIYWFRNGITEWPTCKQCGKQLTYRNPNEGYRTFCCAKCAAINPTTKQKHINTCLEKYGVENPSQSDEIKLQKINTSIKNYGVKYPMQNENIKNEIRQTFIKKYGGYTWASDELMAKVKQTNLKRYGVEYSGASDVVKQKIKQTSLKRYGVENPNQNAEIKSKVRNTMVKKYGLNYMEVLNPPHYKSKLEKEITKFISDMGIKHIDGPYSIIPPLQLDIYLPEYNIAIEVNGSYWHNMEQKQRDYHINKTIMCANKGIGCIHIWDDWKYDDIKEFLRDVIEDKDLSPWVKKWFPDLKEDEWPVDFGLIDGDWREHECVHGGFKCTDSGIVHIQNS